ncbi:hypothetical protein FOMPIDRAFT_1022367 [Fomitopsis schrenkii]|uniref:Uncharacterized protein n=1 Tax=Fomitopsis schrenkii TaxID=2126942 RepID=S8EGD4_FOMSC|nr:hypothetical protein FOMPIDRAFT_1022367 [Fomitopsis schrenkii]
MALGTTTSSCPWRPQNHPWSYGNVRSLCPRCRPYLRPQCHLSACGVELPFCIQGDGDQRPAPGMCSSRSLFAIISDGQRR